MQKSFKLIILGFLISLSAFFYLSGKRPSKNEEKLTVLKKNKIVSRNIENKFDKNRDLFKNGKVDVNTASSTLNISKKDINHSPSTIKSNGPAMLAKIKSHYIEEKTKRLRTLFDLNDEQSQSINDIYEKFWANSLKNPGKNEPKEELIKIIGEKRYLTFLDYQQNLKKIEEENRKLNTVKLIAKKLTLSESQELELTTLLNNTNSKSNKEQLKREIYKILNEEQKKLYQNEFKKNKKQNGINSFMR